MELILTLFNGRFFFGEIFFFKFRMVRIWGFWSWVLILGCEVSEKKLDFSLESLRIMSVETMYKNAYYEYMGQVTHKTTLDV